MSTNINRWFLIMSKQLGSKQPVVFLFDKLSCKKMEVYYSPEKLEFDIIKNKRRMFTAFKRMGFVIKLIIRFIF